MTQSLVHGELRGTLARAGMSDADLAWLDTVGWDDSNIGPITDEAMAAAYARRENVLNATIAGLLAQERGASIEGRLAAAIGAELANWRERDEED